VGLIRVIYPSIGEVADRVVLPHDGPDRGEED